MRTEPPPPILLNTQSFALSSFKRLVRRASIFIPHPFLYNMHSTSIFIFSTLLASATYGFATPANTTEKRALARVYTACTQPKTAAITYASYFSYRLPFNLILLSSFDDGPNTYTKTIVDTLNKAGGKAYVTFLLGLTESITKPFPHD
jgi:hypothetical protein